MLMNTGNKAVASNNGLLTTIAWGIDGKVEYALEGSVFVAGSAITVVCEMDCSFLKMHRKVKKHANNVEDSNGVYIVSCFCRSGNTLLG